MQIFTRSKGEEITLIDKDGTEVTIKVTTVKGGYVKIGVQAPLTMRVLQTEVYKRQRVVNHSRPG